MHLNFPDLKTRFSVWMSMDGVRDDICEGYFTASTSLSFPLALAAGSSQVQLTAVSEDETLFVPALNHVRVPDYSALVAHYVAEFPDTIDRFGGVFVVKIRKCQGPWRAFVLSAGGKRRAFRPPPHPDENMQEWQCKLEFGPGRVGEKIEVKIAASKDLLDRASRLLGVTERKNLHSWDGCSFQFQSTSLVCGQPVAVDYVLPDGISPTHYHKISLCLRSSGVEIYSFSMPAAAIRGSRGTFTVVAPPVGESDDLVAVWVILHEKAMICHQKLVLQDPHAHLYRL